MSKYVEGKPVYFIRKLLYAGVVRKAGEQVDEKFLQDKHHVEKMFRVRLFGHDDSRMATQSGKPIQESPEITKEEVVSEKVEQDSVEKNEDVAHVVVDNEEDFQVEYKGVQFEINRNQIREDGTLTAGGLKAYKAAIA